MARLSSLDSSFLRVETPTAHMHVGWLSMLELPEGRSQLDVAALVEQIAARLHLAPRFRQRLAQPPLSLAEPSWEDDPDFNMLRHVEIVDEPLSRRELSALADDFLSQQLARDRPLWSILIVPSCGPGRAALVGKVHHAMVDGIAAVELGMLLFDATPETSPTVPVLWEPAPASGGPVRLLLDSLADSALEQFRTARQMARLGLSPGNGLRVADNVRRAAMSLAGDVLRPAPPSLLNVEIGPRRRLVRHGVALQRINAIRRERSATLNDVVLAACAGALRRLMLHAGEPPRDLRVMVPVNVRTADDSQPSEGNRISFAFVELPVSEPGPFARLERVHATMAELKRSGRIAGTDLLLRSAGTLPEPFKRRAARLAASPRLYNLTISNVPGPDFPLYAAGARVRSIYPVIPIPDGHVLSFGVLTYDGRVHFSAYVDPDALPRAERLAILLEDAIEELTGSAHTPRLHPAGRALRLVQPPA